MDQGLSNALITDGNKRLWGMDARKRVRRNVAMRENPDRLHHMGRQEGDVRKIALVGTSSSAELAPYSDESWEIWGVGGRQEWMRRADRWYEVHRLAGNSEDWVENWRTQALSFEGKTDIYMHYPEPGFGDKVFQYPVEHIMQRFGTHFLTSSFAWMMAAAIDELYPVDKEPVPGAIGIWGVDMEYGAEYLQQRVGFHHFIDLARVLNINIIRLASSGISFEPVPYPMWQDDPLLNKLDKRQTYARDTLVGLDKSILRTKTMIAQNTAIIEAIKNPRKIEDLEKELEGLNDTLRTMNEDLIHWDGVEQEQQFWRDYIS